MIPKTPSSSVMRRPYSALPSSDAESPIATVPSARKRGRPSGAVNVPYIVPENVQLSKREHNVSVVDRQDPVAIWSDLRNFATDVEVILPRNLILSRSELEKEEDARQEATERRRDGFFKHCAARQKAKEEIEKQHTEQRQRQRSIKNVIEALKDYVKNGSPDLEESQLSAVFTLMGTTKNSNSKPLLWTLAGRLMLQELDCLSKKESCFLEFSIPRISRHFLEQAPFWFYFFLDVVDLPLPKCCTILGILLQDRWKHNNVLQQYFGLVLDGCQLTRKGVTLMNQIGVLVSHPKISRLKDEISQKALAWKPSAYLPFKYGLCWDNYNQFERKATVTSSNQSTMINATVIKAILLQYDDEALSSSSPIKPIQDITVADILPSTTDLLLRNRCFKFETFQCVKLIFRDNIDQEAVGQCLFPFEGEAFPEEVQPFLPISVLNVNEIETEGAIKVMEHAMEALKVVSKLGEQLVDDTAPIVLPFAGDLGSILACRRAEMCRKLEEIPSKAAKLQGFAYIIGGFHVLMNGMNAVGGIYWGDPKEAGTLSHYLHNVKENKTLHVGKPGNYYSLRNGMGEYAQCLLQFLVKEKVSDLNDATTASIQQAIDEVVDAILGAEFDVKFVFKESITAKTKRSSVALEFSKPPESASFRFYVYNYLKHYCLFKSLDHAYRINDSYAIQALLRTIMPLFAETSPNYMRELVMNNIELLGVHSERTRNLCVKNTVVATNLERRTFAEVDLTCEWDIGYTKSIAKSLGPNKDIHQIEKIYTNAGVLGDLLRNLEVDVNAPLSNQCHQPVSACKDMEQLSGIIVDVFNNDSINSGRFQFEAAEEPGGSKLMMYASQKLRHYQTRSINNLDSDDSDFERNDSALKAYKLSNPTHWSALLAVAKSVVAPFLEKERKEKLSKKLKMDENASERNRKKKKLCFCLSVDAEDGEYIRWGTQMLRLTSYGHIW
ncbi:hypothetical protein BDR26DRAFT_984237 [Obelidium mucronatum]|nr:hypothetical protein BDR26DRAFT_984237 [Obelidium mucronatum]